MTRKSQKQNGPGPEEASLEIGDGIGKATGEVAGAPIEPRPSGRSGRAPADYGPRSRNGPLPDVAQAGPGTAEGRAAGSAKIFLGFHR